jgi:hypothetical protein
MTLSISPIKPAIVAGNTISFTGVSGTGPYTYQVVAGGAGGTIDSNGVYTAPPTLNGSNPNLNFDIVQVFDSLNAYATTQVRLGTPIELFCEILERELSLENGRVYLWDQKIMQPKDMGLYIAVSTVYCKPFSNTNSFNGSTNSSEQSTNFQALLGVDIISRGNEARYRKEEVIMALNSTYAQQQQEKNGFYIGKISTGFVNLSQEDGAAIPYRFNISVAIQYSVSKNKVISYYDDFENVEVTTEP